MTEIKTNIPIEIKMGNAGANDVNMPAFKEGSIIFTKDTKKIYIDPIGETERIAVGGGEADLSKKQDFFATVTELTSSRGKQTTLNNPNPSFMLIGEPTQNSDLYMDNEMVAIDLVDQTDGNGTSINVEKKKIYLSGTIDGKANSPVPFLGVATPVKDANEVITEADLPYQALNKQYYEDNAVGKKTAEGGEIFNEYERNFALSTMSHVEGIQNQAWFKGFTVIAIDKENKTLTLDSVEGLSVGMKCSIVNFRYTTDHKEDALIKDVTISAINGNVVTVDKTPTYYKDLNNIYLYVPVNYTTIKEPIGLTITGPSGIHIEGQFNTGIGYISHTEGRNNFNMGNDAVHIEGAENFASGTASHTQGRLNNNYGNYSFVGGVQNNCYKSTSFVFGSKLTCAVSHQVVLGLSNENKTDTVFEFGNGANDGSTHINAFEIYKDGHAELQTQGTTDKSIVVKSELDKKQDLFGTISISSYGNVDIKTTHKSMSFSSNNGLTDIYIDNSVIALETTNEAETLTASLEISTDSGYLYQRDSKNNINPLPVLGIATPISTATETIPVELLPYQAANKIYVDDSVANKLDKVTSAGNTRVYVINADGTQGTMAIASNVATGNTIANRTSTGTLKVATPAEDNDAATKKYVDDSIGNINSILATMFNDVSTQSDEEPTNEEVIA